MYTVTEAAKLIGVGVKTLQRWDRVGILVPQRSPTNRRLYTPEQLREATGLKILHNRKTIIYCRVSSPAQRNDLNNQILAMKKFATDNNIPHDIIIEDVGGGLNFKRDKLRLLLKMIMSKEVDTIIVAHKDRLIRFGFELIEYIAELCGTKIIVANQEFLSPQEEMVQDLLSIVHTFSCRLYGLRRYEKVLKDELSS